MTDNRKMLNIFVQEPGSSSRYIERLLGAREPQHAELAMSITKRFGTRYGKAVSQLKHFTVEKIQQWAAQCADDPSRLARQRVEIGLVSIPSMVGAKIRRLRLPPFSMEGVALDKIVLAEIALKNDSSVLIGEEKKRDVVFKLSKLGSLLGHLKRCLSDT